MRILHVATRHNRGGAERNLRATVEWELDQGHTVVVVVGGDSVSRDFPEGASVIVLDELVREVDPPTDARCVRRLRALIRAERPDVVHTHQSKAGVVGRVAALRLPPAVVHTVHMPSFGPGFGPIESALFRAVERFCARSTDVLVSVGYEVREHYLSQGVGRPERFLIVRSPVEIDRFAAARAPEARGRARRRLGLSDDEAVLLAIGSIEPRKRFDLIVRLLQEDLRANWRLLVAGTGTALDDLKLEVHSLGLDDRVSFLGFVQDAVPLFAAADLLVHAARAEGVPQIVVQACAAGRPVVATQAEGLREVEGARVTIVHRDGSGFRDAVEMALASDDSHPPLSALREWREDAVSEQRNRLMELVQRSSLARSSPQ